jgi:hypothetical protein
MAANTPQTPREGPLSFMTKLSTAVSVYRPEETAVPNGNPSSPKLIIVASWTDARDEHIAKYLVKYQALFPTAQILLLKSTSKIFFKPQEIVNVIRPAVPVIKAALTETTSSSSSLELLIHIFSNGGSSSIANLYDAYASSAGEGEGAILPQHVTILDSSPSVYRFEGSVVFLSLGLSSLQKILAMPIIYLVSCSWSFMVATGLMLDWPAVWGKAHNDTKRHVELRRTYIYSETDGLVNYKDIESHADEAKSNGFNVRMEKFEGSAHVSHARKDESKYWEIVRSTWEGN